MDWKWGRVKMLKDDEYIWVRAMIDNSETFAIVLLPNKNVLMHGIFELTTGRYLGCEITEEDAKAKAKELSQNINFKVFEPLKRKMIFDWE